MPMTIEEIRARYKECAAKLRDLKTQIEHANIDFQHLYLECPHPDKHYYNDPRDPGGAHCEDCGKVW